MARLNLSENLVSPPAPAPGYASIYFKTDNVLYIKDSSGVETPIGTASGITELTGDVTAVGPGVVPATVNFVGGESAADIATSVGDTQAATSANTPSTIVKRDVSGNFSAGIITADLVGDVTGDVTGAASDNVLKTGDTMTGALTISVADVAALKVGTNVLVVDTVSGFIGINKLTPTEALDVVGNGQFSGTIVAFNLSGTNTGNIALQSVGSSPNANGATLGGSTGQDLTLQPANSTNPGVLTALAQNIGGIKTFIAQLLSSDVTQSTDKDTGAIVTEGGLGVEKNINAGGNINAIGTITGSNITGSNSGDITITDTNSVDLVLAGQNLQANLKLSPDAADSGFVPVTTSIHANGLHVEVAYDTPVQIGTANASGTGTKVAAHDHVHAHGNQTSGALHAVATTSVNGFMSSTDKTKLDTVSGTPGTNAQILISDGTTYNPRTVSGDATITNAGVVTVTSSVNFTGSLAGDITGTQGATVIAPGAVTDAKSALAVKPAVTVVATSNQALTGTPTIDGQTTAAGSLILLTAQSTPSQNGPWVAAAGAWTRPTWYANGSTTQAFQFITTFVRLGTVYQGSVWRMTSAGPITIDTTATTWVVTPVSGNYKSSYVVGPQSGSAEVDVVFANANRGTLGWNPATTHSVILPSTQGAAGTTLFNDGSGNLSWANPNTNIDGGRPDSVYTPSQFINGGTP